MANTEDLIRYAIAENLAIVLVVNKMDRLILELRLPPAEAYYKIKHTIEEVNNVIASVDPSPERRLSPELGNVAFASTQMGWCFTTASFAELYGQTYGPMDTAAFADRLWGNIFYDDETRKFSKKSKGIDHPRSFVHFVLEPLYKIYTQVLSEDTAGLRATLEGLGIELKPATYKIDVKPLLKVVLDQFFGPSTGLVDMLVEHVPSPREAAARKVERCYTGPLNTALAQSMITSDPAAPVVFHVSKLYHTADAQEFRAFGRVMAGTLRRGQPVRVLGEGYSPDDEEDAVDAVVEAIWVSESRYFVECEEAPAGSLVLVGGVDKSITKTATIVARSGIEDELYIFSPLKHITQSVLKIAVEPIAPSELPKMLDGLRKINKSYPLVATKVEESGEHVILGTGELYLDSVMHDLRKLFAEIEIKVSDPVVQFRETVIETSALKVYAETPNKKCVRLGRLRSCRSRCRLTLFRVPSALAGTS
jgi:U5 small nuclear ribonucleoprotein component